MNSKIIYTALTFSLILSSEVMAACTCTDLEVKYNTDANSTALSTQYCVADSVNFPECTLDSTNPCGANQKTYNCPIGGKSGNDGVDDWFGVGLEYVITGTDLNTCKYGLALQRDLTEDGMLQANGPTGLTQPQGLVNFDTLDARIYSGGNNNIPNVGDTTGGKSRFTSDNYAAITNTQTIKINGTNTTITFSDLPSIYLDPGDDAKKIVQKDVFMASVRNAAGAAAALCGCEFELTATKNAGGTTLSTVALTEKAKKNCTFTDVP